MIQVRSLLTTCLDRNHCDAKEEDQEDLHMFDDPFHVAIEL